MGLTTLCIALIVLLMTPGPTNTLIMLASAERGMMRALRLIPVELASYLALVVPLALVAEGLADRIGLLRPVVAVPGAIWVLYLAWSMWRASPDAGPVARVTPRRLAVTTLLNPKGVVMGLILIPSAGLGFASLLVLAVTVTLVAIVWAMIGCCLPGAEDGEDFPPLVARMAAVWLAGLSVVIVAGGFSA